MGVREEALDDEPLLRGGLSAGVPCLSNGPGTIVVCLQVLLIPCFSSIFPSCFFSSPRAVILSKLFILSPPLFIDSSHLPVPIEQLLCAFCKQMIMSKGRVCGEALLGRELLSDREAFCKLADGSGMSLLSPTHSPSLPCLKRNIFK
uniref:Uncharacterized protein n=1 Tax=Myotis myotis TaxID=51298 RepID=A0A7J7WVU6_MYOMY|nr:hypothetical protein mMyoMyo1_011976 [Myotis myotis]